MADWISVKDRLPEKAGSYLVIGKSGGAYVTHFYTANEYNKGAHFSSPYVTHWQERPEAPERPKPDLVEVVRCKDCAKRYKQCFDKVLNDNDFCSLGERKESEVEGE